MDRNELYQKLIAMQQQQVEQAQPSSAKYAVSLADSIFGGNQAQTLGLDKQETPNDVLDKLRKLQMGQANAQVEDEEREYKRGRDKASDKLLLLKAMGKGDNSFQEAKRADVNIRGLRKSTEGVTKRLVETRAALGKLKDAFGSGNLANANRMLANFGRVVGGDQRMSDDDAKRVIQNKYANTFGAFMDKIKGTEASSMTDDQKNNLLSLIDAGAQEAYYQYNDELKNLYGGFEDSAPYQFTQSYVNSDGYNKLKDRSFSMLDALKPAEKKQVLQAIEKQQAVQPQGIDMNRIMELRKKRGL